MSRIVYVDFDGTVTRSNLVHYLFYIKWMRFLKDKRIADLFGCFSVLIAIPILVFLTRIGRARVRDRYFYKKYRGLPLALVESSAERFWRNRGHRYENTAVIERLRNYRAQSLPLVIISGSLRPIIQGWDAVYGLCDEIISTELTSDRDLNLTGKIKGEPVLEEQKRKAIENYERSKGLDIQTRICLSDAYEDVPMLSYATDPIVVNPDKRLRRHAESSNWEIMLSY